MNCLRLSGSRVEFGPGTCSALTVVPRITKMSTPASTTALANCAVRIGESAAATVTPPARISAMREAMRSSRIGSA